VDGSCSTLQELILSADEAVSLFITNLGSHSNTRFSGQSQGAAGVQKALHVASVVPCVNWDSVKAAAAQTAAWADAEIRKKVTALHLFASTIPSLRTVAMLAMVGALTEQQKQGVVALLGERSSGCSNVGASDNASTTSATGSTNNSSSMVLEEPAELVSMRAKDGTTLADLFQALLFTLFKQVPEYTSQVSSCVVHMRQAFSSVQLPLLATLTAATRSPATLQNEDLNTPAFIKLSTAASSKEIYLSWVHATCLTIINDVLSSTLNLSLRPAAAASG
jgi:hypothetical protein